MCQWFEGETTVYLLVRPSSIILGGLPELFQTQWRPGETPAGLLPWSLTLGARANLPSHLVQGKNLKTHLNSHIRPQILWIF
jgi:hypothetical protein